MSLSCSQRLGRASAASLIRVAVIYMFSIMTRLLLPCESICLATGVILFNAPLVLQLCTIS